MSVTGTKNSTTDGWYVMFSQLVIMTPKSLLRHADAKSPISDMVEGTCFQRVIPDEMCMSEDAVRRLIFCTGKLYYELIKEREGLGLQSSVAICRVEQLSPFPYDLILKELGRYPHAELVWAQEEPKNMGAWSYVQPRLSTTSGPTRKIRLEHLHNCAEHHGVVAIAYTPKHTN